MFASKHPHPPQERAHQVARRPARRGRRLHPQVVLTWSRSSSSCCPCSGSRGRRSEPSWSRSSPSRCSPALEKTAAILVTLVTQGPAAAWEQIKAELTELKDQLIGQVSSDDPDRGRQGGGQEAREHAQPGRGGDPGDHRDLQHGDVLHREGQPDRRRAWPRSSTRSRRSPPGQVEPRRQAGRADAGQHADRGASPSSPSSPASAASPTSSWGSSRRSASRSTRASTRSSPGSARCSRSSSAPPRSGAKKLLEWWRKKVPISGR